MLNLTEDNQRFTDAAVHATVLMLSQSDTQTVQIFFFFEQLPVCHAKPSVNRHCKNTHEPPPKCSFLGIKATAVTIQKTNDKVHSSSYNS